ncbi:flavodoxin [Agrilactobacillus fermenti]|uniref:flavodoxin n=1 Tax=Agrilactobacillus fermenti TaxID=2586909 RepID=UPI001E38951C|nr:flavodoxin [Agrilactobacillus fermenti]MCD2256462.1 flavodoxin [Agrilactobacillus fermenti]
MANIKLVYASMGGRNEQIANYLQEYLESQGATVDKSEISQTDATDLENFDVGIVVTYTYHDGDLPDEAVDFFEDLKQLDLHGKIYGVAGSSSKKHQHFGRAVDYFDAAFQQIGAVKGAENVKINGDPETSDLDDLRMFADQLLNA